MNNYPTNNFQRVCELLNEFDPFGFASFGEPVKEYERLTVQAAIEQRWDIAALALSVNPIVGSWAGAKEFLAGLANFNDYSFATFRQRDILLS